MTASYSALRQALARRALVLLALGAGLNLLGLVGGDVWPLELLSHFQPHALLVLSCGCLWLLVLGRWRLGLPCLALVLFNAAGVLPWYLPARGQLPPGPSRSLRLFLANVQTMNVEYDLVLEQIRREDPDIVVLQETNASWIAALRGLETRYPHHLSVPRSDNFGMALYSRLALDDLRVVELGTAQVPSIVGSLSLGGSRTTLIATHPLPPTGSKYFSWRNEQLEAVARLAAEQPQAIVIGDLNTTMWSAHYGRFEGASGLKNVRRGFGILPTWPVGLGLLKIPLDHCLVPHETFVEDVRRGAESGADHLPLIVDLRVPGR